jgi:hypothetical protein
LCIKMIFNYNNVSIYPFKTLISKDKINFINKFTRNNNKSFITTYIMLILNPRDVWGLQGGKTQPK